MIGKKKKYSSAFKSKVVLEALKERNTLTELASKYEVSQFMICRWKKEFLDNSASIFENKTRKNKLHKDEKEKELYAKIGKLEMKVDFLKRASEVLGVPMPEDY